MTGGARNAVLRGTDAGDQYVFKSSQRTENQIAWLEHVQIAARAVGLHVSVPQPAQDGTCLQSGWTMERFVHGRTATATEMRRLAPLVAALHKATSAVPQRPGFASAPDLMHQDRGGDIDLSRMPPDVVSLCRAAWGLVPDEPVGIIHADLTPSNVIITPEGTPVLLDWDEARADLQLFDRVALGEVRDPISRAASLAFEIVMCWCIEHTRARDLARDLSHAVSDAQIEYRKHCDDTRRH